MSAHLANAARALEHILHELHPERNWVVSVREGDLADGDDAVSRNGSYAGSVSDDSHALIERPNPAATTGALDEDALDEAA